MTFFRGVLDLGKMGDLMKECTVHKSIEAALKVEI